MTDHQTTIWNKLASFQIETGASDFTFEDRLIRENGWAPDYASRVIEEYKKFLFLVCISPHPLTPSDQVDQAWHLHLIYTRSYWVDLCQNTLNKDIHHGPTKGGNHERQKFKDAYASTKALYRATFGYDPPVDIWPSSRDRFGEINFRRISLHKFWIFPKPAPMVRNIAFLITALLVGLLFIQASNGEIVFAFICFAFLFVVFRALFRSRKKTYKCRKCSYKKTVPGICPTCDVHLIKEKTHGKHYTGGNIGCSGCSGCSGCGGCGS